MTNLDGEQISLLCYCAIIVQDRGKLGEGHVGNSCIISPNMCVYNDIKKTKQSSKTVL